MLLATGLFACTEEAPEYQKAIPFEGDGVYFSKTLPAQIDVDSSNVFTFKVNRMKTDGDLNVELTITADTLFRVNTTAAFAAGAASANIEVTFDHKKLEFDKKYEFEATLDSMQTTIYGLTSYKFSAVLPNPTQWDPIETEAAIVMNVWNMGLFGEEVYPVYVEKQRGKEIYRIANIFSTYKDDKGKEYTCPYYVGDEEKDGIAKKELIKPLAWTIIDAEGDYLKKLDPSYKMEPGEVFIPAQSTNVKWPDWGEFIFGSLCYNVELPGVGLVIPGTVLKVGVANLGKFDKEKKMLSWGMCFFDIPEGKNASLYVPEAETKLYLDKKLMIEDYNAPSYKWVAPAVYSGEVASSALEDEWSALLMVGEKDVTLYQIPDYFDIGFGLSFVSDSISKLKKAKAGAEFAIADVKNFQETGIEFLGRKLQANVKKGKVTFGKNGLPTFTIKLHLFSMPDSDHPETLDFGEFEEVFTADFSNPMYTVNDLKPAKKEDLVGKWACKAADYSILGNPGEFIDFNIEVSYLANDTFQYPVTEDSVAVVPDAEIYGISGLGGPYSAMFQWNDFTIAAKVPTDKKGNGVLFFSPVASNLVMPDPVPGLLSRFFQPGETSRMLMVIGRADANGLALAESGNLLASVTDDGRLVFCVDPATEQNLFGYFAKDLGFVPMFWGSGMYGEKVSATGSKVQHELPANWNARKPVNGSLLRNTTVLKPADTPVVRHLNTTQMGVKRTYNRTVNRDAQVLRVW